MTATFVSQMPDPVTPDMLQWQGELEILCNFGAKIEGCPLEALERVNSLLKPGRTYRVSIQVEELLMQNPHAKLPDEELKKIPEGIIPDGKRCEHGNRHHCGFCANKSAPRCKHGNPWYCGFCEIVENKVEDVTPPPSLPLGENQ